MTAITASKLGAALRRRFPGGPKEALRALGIDENVLAPAAPGGGDGDGEKLKALRVDLERLLSENKHTLPDGIIAKILALLDEHVDLGALPATDPYAERVRALNGDDADEEAIGKVRALFRKAGMSDDDIEEALRIAKNGGGNDRLPLPATRGGIGGRTADTRLALDARASCDAMFGTARINSDAGLTMDSGRRRHITAAEEANFAELFPDACRIQTGAK